MCNGKRFEVMRVEFSIYMTEAVVWKFRKEIAINKNIGSM